MKKTILSITAALALLAPAGCRRTPLPVENSLVLEITQPEGDTAEKTYIVYLYNTETGKKENFDVARTGRNRIACNEGHFVIVVSELDINTVNRTDEEFLSKIRLKCIREDLESRVVFDNCKELMRQKNPDGPYGSPGHEGTLVSSMPGTILSGHTDTLDIPKRNEKDALTYTVNVSAEESAKTTQIVFDNVTGAEYIYNVRAFLSNMASEKLIGINDTNVEETALEFIMKADTGSDSITGEMTHFGKTAKQGCGTQTLYMIITDTGYGRTLFSFDLSEYFKENTPKTIRISNKLAIDKPENNGSESSGGILPQLDDWVGENETISIGK